jgi:hypothetical protein
MVVSIRLVRASRIMGRLSAVGVVLVPLVVVAAFLFPDATRALDISFNHLGADLTNAIPFGDRLCALAFALVPVAISTWGLFALARLFRCFAEGEIFSAGALRALSRVTAALFGYVLAAFAMQLPISYFLTAHTGRHELSLTLGSDDVATLFVAGVAFVIARVMAEARQMADENASFV